MSDLGLMVLLAIKARGTQGRGRIGWCFLSMGDSDQTAQCDGCEDS